MVIGVLAAAVFAYTRYRSRSKETVPYKSLA
jgi:hypothetical protein